MTYPPEMPLVLVEWVDSNCASGWHDVADMMATTGQGCGCRSVGWLLTDGDDRIVLVPHQSETGQVSDAMTIPRVAVVSVTRLEVPA